MLAKAYRLHEEKDFDAVRKWGKRQRIAWMGVGWLWRERNTGVKIGFIVPNAVIKRATQRNFIKRKLRMAAFRLKSMLPEGAAVVIAVKEAPSDTTFSAVLDIMKHAFTRISSDRDMRRAPSRVSSNSHVSSTRSD